MTRQGLKSGSVVEKGLKLSWSWVIATTECGFPKTRSGSEKTGTGHVANPDVTLRSLPVLSRFPVSGTTGENPIPREQREQRVEGLQGVLVLIELLLSQGRAQKSPMKC